MTDARDIIESACPDATLGMAEHRGETTVEVRADRLGEVARFLAGPQLGYVLLSDLACADFPENAPEPRFRCAYQLFSLDSSSYLRLHAWAADNAAGEPELPTVSDVWPTANWHEREIYDMFGVRFHNHPDLCRILMPLDWEGHPLRRDYPLGGEEVEFSDVT